MTTFEQHTDIDAPIETVWSILANTSQWPLWFPGIDGATNLSAVDSGATFQFQSGGETNTGMITRADPNQRLELTTEHGGHQATHTFQLAHHGGLFGFGGQGTRLEYTYAYEVAGGIIGSFIAGGNPVDTLKVKHTLDKVKELAEGAAGNR
jgi:uncharacterized protein YndB with AHSA1/START domain